MTKKEIKFRKQLNRIATGKGDNTLQNITSDFYYKDLLVMEFDDATEVNLMAEYLPIKRMQSDSRLEHLLDRKIAANKKHKSFRSLKVELKTYTLGQLRMAYAKFPSVYEIKEAINKREALLPESTYNVILEKMTDELKGFKKLYLAKVHGWAVKNYENKIQYFEVDFRTDPLYSEMKTMRYGKHEYRDVKSGYVDLMLEVARMKHTTKETYADGEVRDASIAFDGKTAKLSSRLDKYKFKPSKLVIISEIRNGINIHLTVSDGTQTRRFYTIIASGPIQRPHYRYLDGVA